MWPRHVMIRFIIFNFAAVVLVCRKFPSLIIALLLIYSTGSIAQFTIKVTIRCQETLISELLKHLETLLIRQSF